MYNIISLPVPSQYLLESKLSDLDPFQEAEFTFCERVYMEAVFVNGKEKVQGIIDAFQKIKDQLEAEIKIQDDAVKADPGKYPRKVPKDNSKAFDPEKFWRSDGFKELEDAIATTFGFRDVSVEPFIEKYNSRTKLFETTIMNAAVWQNNRFPVEGLVTENGFYDKSKSIRMMVVMSLGLIHALDAEEMTAVLLHEFGHGIDPACVDIRYVEVNALSKYLMDKKGAINKQELRLTKEVGLFGMLMDAAVSRSKKLLTTSKKYTKKFCFGILDVITGGRISERARNKLLAKVQKKLDSEQELFTRQEFNEAFADNFARMYGMGPQLIRALKKMGLEMDQRIRSRIVKEKARQRYIVSMTLDMIQDCHKTDIHRIHALLKEYREDIKNPQTPPEVRKQLKEDMEILETLLHEYEHDFDDMQNRVNHLISEDLKRKYGMAADMQEIDEMKKTSTQKSKKEPGKAEQASDSETK